MFLLLFADRFLDTPDGTEALSAGIVMLIGVGTIPNIERYFQKVTDRFFFKDRYDYAKALEELSSVLNTHIEFSTLVPQLLRTLQAILHPESIEFFHAKTGMTFDLIGPRDTIPYPALLPENKLRIEVTDTKRGIGTFIIGTKRSGDPYTAEDHTLLRTFATQASVAFQKAELYDQLREHSQFLEQKVEERTKNIVELQKHQRQMFDDISHALQTPITVLKSAMELFSSSNAQSNNSTIETMGQSIENLSRLIRDLLQLARIDAIPIEEQGVPVDLSEIIGNVVEYVEVICQQKSITILTQIESPSMIRGNRKQIDELVTNLLSNAVKYTADSKVREISIVVRTVDDHIELTIKDTGSGIQADLLPNIFERFYRAHDRDPNSTGYGLGLAIVKRIVERHNGTIAVSSTQDVGTCFTIEFPCLDQLQ